MADINEVALEFGHICSSALLTMAEDIIGPLLDATDAAGIRLRYGIRTVSEGRDPSTTDPNTTDPKDQT